MSKLVWCDIPAEDETKQKLFYETVFGWSLDRLAGAKTPLIFKKENETVFAGLGAGKRGAGLLPYFSTEDLDKALDAVRLAGGTVVNEPQTIEGYGIFAIIKDPETNLLGIWQWLKKTPCQ